MGFPDTFVIPSGRPGVSHTQGVSDTQAYRQFGNSVVVPAIKEVARIMKPHLHDQATGAKAA